MESIIENAVWSGEVMWIENSPLTRRGAGYQSMSSVRSSK